MKNSKAVGMIALAAALLAGCGDNEAISDAGSTSENGERTSGYSEDRNAYFGDLHIHTKNSFDAYIFNVRATPEDAYRFAKGETLKHPSGYDINLGGPPLDFLGVTDHAAYLGILPAMDGVDERLSALPIAKELYGKDPNIIVKAFNLIGGTVRSGKAIEEIKDDKIIGQTWAATIAAAEKYNEPGTFTTFSGYEFTSTYAPNQGSGSFAGGNLHRNVIFKNSAPDMPFSVLESPNPEDLWDWMDQQREAGNEVLAIPHNSNVSDSQMFKPESYDGTQPFDRAYAEQRMRNEPLVEITQVKGTSETHPALSPNDEWANFEIYDKLLASDITSDTRYSYVRQAVRDGMLMQDKQGFNPFQFGFIGSSDSHVAGGAFSEDKYWSKVGIIDGTPVQRGSVPPGGNKTWDGVSMDANAKNWFSRWAASGLAGVWAEENTRASIFAAMRRKETFATSGPRIKLRFFAGFDFAPALLDDPMLVRKAYKNGVAMGGDLINEDGKAPAFIAWAMRDPDAAPLQRLQVIKLWSDGEKTYEEVIDIACSDGLVPDANGRCPDNGASVDLTDCSITLNKGAGDLRVVWRDPKYRKGQRAAYYLRALENPTCRWSTWDALMAGVAPNPALKPTLQERAWSSPIWLAPAG